MSFFNTLVNESIISYPSTVIANNKIANSTTPNGKYIPEEVLYAILNLLRIKSYFITSKINWLILLYISI